MVLKTLQEMKKHREWQSEHDATAPRVGDVAPDFELFDVNGDNPVRLSGFRGAKPVALIFGSYT